MSQKTKPLVQTDTIRLGMIGCTPGNGHPYSWSAMFNGYDREAMTNECPFSTIPAYLNKEPAETLTVANASVTHICCVGEGDFSAEHVAKCALIPNVTEKPEDMIGNVDAVVIATDIGHEHVARAKPFVEAGLPLFIDKPMVDNSADLATFNAWIQDGKPIVSSSSLRYTKEFAPYRLSTHNLGQLRYVTITTAKKWETYGIHALEAMYPIVGPGFVSAQNTGTYDRNVVHYTHKDRIDVVVVSSKDMLGGGGKLTLCGTSDFAQLAVKDSFFSFKTQMETFIHYLRTGQRPFPYSETEELMRMLIAGIRSREEGGRKVKLSEVL